MKFVSPVMQSPNIHPALEWHSCAWSKLNQAQTQAWHGLAFA